MSPARAADGGRPTQATRKPTSGAETRAATSLARRATRRQGIASTPRRNPGEEEHRHQSQVEARDRQEVGEARPGEGVADRGRHRRRASEGQGLEDPGDGGVPGHPVASGADPQTGEGQAPDDPRGPGGEDREAKDAPEAVDAGPGEARARVGGAGVQGRIRGPEGALGPHQVSGDHHRAARGDPGPDPEARGPAVEAPDIDRERGAVAGGPRPAHPAGEGAHPRPVRNAAGGSGHRPGEAQGDPGEAPSEGEGHEASGPGGAEGGDGGGHPHADEEERQGAHARHARATPDARRRPQGPGEEDPEPQAGGGGEGGAGGMHVAAARLQEPCRGVCKAYIGA